MIDTRFGFIKSISMISPQAHSMPVAVPQVNLQSDDECVRKLTELLEYQDNRNLDEIAQLISRLAVVVE